MGKTFRRTQFATPADRVKHLNDDLAWWSRQPYNRELVKRDEADYLREVKSQKHRNQNFLVSMHGRGLTNEEKSDLIKEYLNSEMIRMRGYSRYWPAYRHIYCSAHHLDELIDWISTSYWVYTDKPKEEVVKESNVTFDRQIRDGYINDSARKKGYRRACAKRLRREANKINQIAKQYGDEFDDVYDQPDPSEHIGKQYYWDFF